MTAPDPLRPRESPDVMAVPDDAAARRGAAPVDVYPPGTLPAPPLAAYDAARESARAGERVVVPPREARTLHVPAGSFLRISVVEGSQVGDLNLWAAHDLSERFFSGKTRALHGTHLTRGDRLWSGFPHLRPMATITADSLAWYGMDEDGCGVHDVIGTRCDPYTNRLLSGAHYHHCCHSNLARALARELGTHARDVEHHVHDVLNVFMCTGFDRRTGRYVMKASPARTGDHVELLAEIDLLVALSACPGGDCATGHSSDAAACHPLSMEVWTPAAAIEGRGEPPRNDYDRSHGEGGGAQASSRAARPPV